MTVVTKISDITEHPVDPAGNQTPDRGYRAAYGYAPLHTDNQFTDGHIWSLFRFDLPEEGSCHRNKQEKFHLSIINTKCLSINRPSPSAVC